MTPAEFYIYTASYYETIYEERKALLASFDDISYLNGYYTIALLSGAKKVKPLYRELVQKNESDNGEEGRRAKTPEEIQIDMMDMISRGGGEIEFITKEELREIRGDVDE